MENDWIHDAMDGFMKVSPGTHTLKVFGPPIKSESKWGKEQYVFEGAHLDGQSGKLAANKGLLRLIATESLKRIEMGTKAGRTDPGFPVEIRFRRDGDDLKTKYSVVE